MGSMTMNATDFGSSSQPLSVGFFSYGQAMTENEIKTTLRDNVTSLLTHAGRRVSQHELAKLPGISVGSAGRMLGGESDVRLETIHAAAKAFELETWQILVPGLDPSSPPVLGGIEPAWPFDESLFRRLMSLSLKSRHIIEGRLEEAIRDREALENQRAAM